MLNYERIINATLATGYANGKELLPYITKGGCSCSEKKEQERPLLVWGPDSSADRVNLIVSEKLKQQLEGLASVTSQLAERLAVNGGLGDWGSDIDWITCFLTCLPIQLWCIITASHPVVCQVHNCFDYCNARGGFGPPYPNP